MALHFSLTNILLLLIALTLAFQTLLFKMDIIYLLQVFVTTGLLCEVFSFSGCHHPQLGQHCILLHITRVRQFNQIGLNLILDEGYSTKVWWLQEAVENPAPFYFLLCQP